MHKSSLRHLVVSTRHVRVFIKMSTVNILSNLLEMMHGTRYIIVLLVNMTLMKENPILIKNLHLLKEYNGKKLMEEFPSKNWNM